MMEWILVIIFYTAQGDQMIPVSSFKTEQQCIDNSKLWDAEPGVMVECLPGAVEDVTDEIEQPKRKHRRRRN